jgi:hypothetical protein
VTDGAGVTTKEWVERIKVLGFPAQPTKVVTGSGSPVEFTYNAQTSTLVIKKPMASVMGPAEIIITTA